MSIRTIFVICAATALSACSSKEVRPDASVAPTQAPAVTLEGVEWRLVEWGAGEPVRDGENVTLRVDEDKFVGRAACNRYFAPFTEGTAPGELTVAHGGSTRMMCDPVSMDAESRFLTLLPTVTAYFIDDGQLTLLHPTGRLRFRPSND